MNIVSIVFIIVSIIFFIIGIILLLKKKKTSPTTSPTTSQRPVGRTIEDIKSALKSLILAKPTANEFEKCAQNTFINNENFLNCVASKVLDSGLPTPDIFLDENSHMIENCVGFVFEDLMTCPHPPEFNLSSALRNTFSK